MSVVFLGGTCANNRWREVVVIPALQDLGIPEERIFNPNLEPGMWNEAAQALEDQVKRECALMVYYIGDTRDGKGVSLYSAVEATMALYDDPERTLVVIDPAGTEGHVAKALHKITRDLRRRFPQAVIADNLHDLITHIGARLSR
jgi:hypothetical protein